MTGRTAGGVRRGRGGRVRRALAAAVVLAGVAAVAGGAVPEQTGAGDGAPAAAAGADPDRRREDTSPPAPTTSPAPPGDPLAAPAPSRPADALAEAAARARRITDRTTEWASFTLVDRATGRTVGDSRAAQRTNVESVVKAWLAADLLATAERAARQLTAYERGRMATMLRDSDDDDAEVIWRQLGGDSSIRRMISTCRMTDTTVYPEMWSLTQISPRDMARLGSCLVPGPGRLLSARTGRELLGLMRTVSRSDAFGIPEAQPAGAGVPVAVKNGWTEHGGAGRWNVNCLAMWGEDLRWVLAVAVRYPTPRGLAYGAGICRRVTDALFP